MVKKLLLPFPLLSDSDPDGELIKTVGTWDEQGQIAKPSIFVLDRSAVVRFAYVGQDYVDRPGDEPVFQALEQAAGSG
jgi:peroxiredoxin